jgi:hypothetical protein
MRGSSAVVCPQGQMTGCNVTGRRGDRLSLSSSMDVGGFKLLNRGGTSREQYHDPGDRHRLCVSIHLQTMEQIMESKTGFEDHLKKTGRAVLAFSRSPAQRTT